MNRGFAQQGRPVQAGIEIIADSKLREDQFLFFI